MRKITKFYVVLVLLVSFVLGSSITVCAYTIGVEGGIKNPPVALVSYSGFTPATITAIYYSCQTWNNQACSAIVNSAGWTHNNNVYNKTSRDNENRVTKGERDIGTYLMQTHRFKEKTLLGPWRIVEADIDINVSYPFDNNGESGSYDIQNCMTHEVGHMIGLDHSAVPEATMYESGPTGETSKRSLSQDDIHGVFYLYGC